MNFSRLLMRYLSPTVVYLDKVPFNLGLDGGVVSDNMPKKGCRIMILGKHTYHETTVTFPFKNPKEIKAAVSLDQTAYAPFTTDLFFLRIISRKQENTLVNLWFVRPSMIDAIHQASPWVIFPETALWSLADAHKPCLYIISRKDDQLMVHLDSDGGVRSSLAPNDDEITDAFQKSLGPGGQNCPIERLVSYQEYYQGLLARLCEMSIADVSPFLGWRVDLKDFNTPFIRMTVISIAVWIILYGCIWAGLPYWKQRQLIQENEKLSANLGEVLHKQDQIESIQNEIKKLSQPMETYTPKVPLFNMLYQTLSGQATITRMRIAGNRVEITGLAPQASEVLSALSAVKAIDNVQLTAALSKNRQTGQEAFTLSFLVKPHIFFEPVHSDSSEGNGG